MTFSLEKSMGIFLYGGSAKTIKKAGQLRENGYQVLGIIDKNPKREMIKEIPIVTLEKAALLFTINTCVIICLQNVRQHEKVVKQLYEVGMNRVLCLGAPDNLTDEENRQMMGIYRCFLSQEYSCCTDIPVLHDICFSFNIENTILSQSQTCVTWLAPIECLYTRQNDDAPDSISNKNISTLHVYIELFRYIQTGEGSVKEYLDIYGNGDEAWEKELLKDRIQLNKKFETELEWNAENFFRNSASSADITGDGRIIIKDGVHRIIFLILAGFKRVPVETSVNQYKAYFSAEKLKDYYQKAGNIYCEYPVPYWLLKKMENGIRAVYLEIVEWLDYADINKEEWLFVDETPWNGYAARAAFRGGIKNICIADKECREKGEILFDFQKKFEQKKESGKTCLVVQEEWRQKKKRSHYNFTNLKNAEKILYITSAVNSDQAENMLKANGFLKLKKSFFWENDDLFVLWVTMD